MDQAFAMYTGIISRFQVMISYKCIINKITVRAVYEGQVIGNEKGPCSQVIILKV